MFRITSQLCEVFDCNKLQLEASGILNIFNEWLKLHPEISVSRNLERGEEINGKIADKFFDFYKNNKAN